MLAVGGGLGGFGGFGPGFGQLKISPSRAHYHQSPSAILCLGKCQGKQKAPTTQTIMVATGTGVGIGPSFVSFVGCHRFSASASAAPPTVKGASLWGRGWGGGEREDERERQKGTANVFFFVLFPRSRT